MSGKPILKNGLSAGQGVNEVSTTQDVHLGTVAHLDERTFIYASHVGSGLGIGVLTTTAAAGTNGIYTSVAYSSGGAAGTNTVTVTTGAGATTANQFAEGYLSVIDGTGSGQYRRIKGHAAAGSSSSLEVEVYDNFETTIASAELSLVVNPYSNIIVTPGNSRALMPLGVTQCIVSSGTANTQYFWLQTGGPALVLGDGSTFAEGALVVPAVAGTADAGQVTLGREAGTGTGGGSDSVMIPAVGYILEAFDASSDGDFRWVYLTIHH